ncbi:MAG: nucleotidyl transferase AbiEii/AbiGii toxin family protein [Propionibacteriaceae bacterium]|nr:nucleotidyl transferase AbiEii/AbiGii toxin family protein [Propionibacteriaceae bacterium]
MLPFHQRLARIALAALGRRGFALAGGYALSANGMGDRPSADVDLFTDDTDRVGAFQGSRDALVETLSRAGFSVQVTTDNPGFCDVAVTDPATGERSDMQLGIDSRQHPPVMLSGIGPVLDERDAVAAKMGALWSRAEVRDLIDIDTVVTSGRFTRDQVLELGDTVERLPLDRHMLAERFRHARDFPAQAYRRYAVDENRRTQIIANYEQWADQIDPGPGNAAPDSW